MKDGLKRELGTAGVAFTETMKKMISSGGCKDDGFWVEAEGYCFSQFQDILVKYKDNHSIEELVFFSLVMGQAVEKTMVDLHKFRKESEE